MQQKGLNLNGHIWTTQMNSRASNKNYYIQVITLLFELFDKITC